MGQHKCVYCGKDGYASFYFCKEHLEMRRKGLLEKCEDCGKWYLVNEGCKCKEAAAKIAVTVADAKTTAEMPAHKTTVIEKPNSKCIICNTETDGHLFCKSCYQTYKNKALLLKITNCTDVVLLDVSYEGHFVCDDGHIVKSLSEVTIDNYLYHEKIQHAYEQAVPIADENGKIHNIKPDFYLPEYDIYIEHFGITNNAEYDRQKEFKLKLYEKEGLTVMCTKFKDLSSAKASLTQKIKFPKRGEIYE